MNEREIIFSRNAADIRSGLAQIDADAIGRRSGAMQRVCRKLSMSGLLHVLVALSAERLLTLERIAAVVRLHLGGAYSKQALCKRVASGIDRFLLLVAAELFSALPTCAALPQGVFKGFGRVLAQDSTTVALPDRFASAFKGSSNQRKSNSTMKIQLIMDLLNSSISKLSLSGFDRNDQAASGDVLEVAQRGDLVLRDLGYFVLSTFSAMAEKGIYFLSRYRSSVTVYDPDSGKQLNLAKILSKDKSLDRTVLLGERERLALRLVAIPVPDAVANERRRKAKANRDKRLNPSRDRLFLMGWSIFITNVGPEKWTAKQVDTVYRLRWRIEVVFKAWKSHLRIHELNTASETLLRASIASKLIFCAIVHRTHMAIEALAPAREHASILRVANLLGNFSLVFAATLLAIPLNQFVSHLIQSHAFYERRRDRINYQETIEALCLG